MATHTAIAITAKGVYDAIQLPTQKPGPGEILLKHSYSSMIAFDTYMTDMDFLVFDRPFVLGLNASGTILEVGSGVNGLAVGDRVVAFTIPGAQARAMQQYSVLSYTQCAKIPDSLALDSAATIPDNFVTAFYTLFDRMKFPIPESFPASTPPPSANKPILIYGAGATSGQYAIQLLKLAGYRNILATASSKHHAFLRELGATHTFDYSSPNLAKEIINAAGSRISLVVDCITSDGTLSAISKFISSDGAVALLLPIKQGSAVRGAADAPMSMSLSDEESPFPKSVDVIGIQTFKYHANEYLKEHLMPEILPALLSAGNIQPNRVRLLDQGTLKERVDIGLDLLRHNKVSGEKVIVKIDG